MTHHCNLSLQNIPPIFHLYLYVPLTWANPTRDTWAGVFSVCSGNIIQSGSWFLHAFVTSSLNKHSAPPCDFRVAVITTLPLSKCGFPSNTFSDISLPLCMLSPAKDLVLCFAEGGKDAQQNPEATRQASLMIKCKNLLSLCLSSHCLLSFRKLRLYGPSLQSLIGK